jgi:oxalate decarboxylase
MSEVTRRSVLGTAAATAGGLVAGSVLPAGAAPKDSADAPASYKFRLEAQEPKVYPGGTTREASVRNFPVSKGIAGVSMRLKPGALRELHWHANAAEWGLYLTGRARLTIVSPDRQWETIECGSGDLAYIPRGYAHYIQNVSQEECHFILVFDSGLFNEFSTFSVTAWLAATPREVRAKDLGIAAAALAALPRGEVYIVQGRVPEQSALTDSLARNLKTPGLTHHFRLAAQEPDIHAGGSVQLATAANFPASTTIAGGLMKLKARGLREMHWHPNADEWDYFIKGRARMTVFSPDGNLEPAEFGPGDVAYVPQGFGHYIENIAEEECEFLLAFNNGLYEEISLSDWLARSPRQVVATNLGLSEETVAKFRRQSAFIDAGNP